MSKNLRKESLFDLHLPITVDQQKKSGHELNRAETWKSGGALLIGLISGLTQPASL